MSAARFRTGAMRDGLPAASMLALMVTAAGLAARPLLPIDETRYASVAWEMYRTGDWLVPHLNGQPYSDKPPLLFWAIVAGWRIFGASSLWARLVAPLFGVGALALAARLARHLWPDRDAPSALAPLVLVGTPLWLVYATMTLFDTLLTCGVLIAFAGMIGAWRGGGLRSWSLAALGIGLGLFAKGPVVFLHVLPVALLAPWWTAGARPASWARWYGGLGLALLGGAALVLAWALPAAWAGGPEYAQQIFLRQTMGRLVRAFAHNRPLGWYLPIAPLLGLPWLLWPRLWRAFASLHRAGWDAGARFCAGYVASVFVAFSLISGKQVHYLVPLVPALALLEGRALDGAGGGAARRGVLRIAVAAAALVAGVQIGASRMLHEQLDLAPIAVEAAALERAGRPIAYAGLYAGEYHYLGRLTRPFEVIEEDGAKAWLDAHPDGAVIEVVDGDCAASDADTVVLAHRWRRGTVCLTARRGEIHGTPRSPRAPRAGRRVRSGFGRSDSAADSCDSSPGGTPRRGRRSRRAGSR
jgi:4-amino-4-deoxy-L-arabinose transferase-like glycosyltransferase